MKKYINSLFKYIRRELNPNQATSKTVSIMDLTLGRASNLQSTALNMYTSALGIDLIANFEGLRLNAYDDGTGVWTIGYGTTRYPNGDRVKKGDRCTEAQAKRYMQHDLQSFEQTVNTAIQIDLTQNQFDALVSLTYNIGSGAFRQSTLVKKLNAGEIKAAADQFDVWIYAAAQPMQGLINRRSKEKALFLQKS
ncbi:lysozyme [Acinetobacter calcoaceticus]|uniref:Lysozyme n=1 Tax=Acinetobacter calcoaceticus TaxID=471 RepID=A0A4R1XQC2_ACICA|nr:lysozyme [Acinetobacter calcoaceticus]